MHVGFTVIERGPEVRLEITFPDAGDRPALITAARRGDQSAVLMGRLYYRDERLADLRPRLSLAEIQECTTTDAALALAVYRAFGQAGLERLEGDFALVIADGRTSRLIGLRDPMGGYPLYWAERDGRFTLSTGLAPLLDFLGRRSVSREYLADFLMMYGQRNEGTDERCAYEGVQRVLPGSIVVIDRPARTIQRRMYWNWLNQLRDPGTDRLDQVAERYAHEFQAAVRERMRGRTLAHLSGGMDSTSVALLARDLVDQGAAEGPLHTLSLVYDRFPKLARERPFIESVLRREKGFVAHRVPADDLLDYDAYADAPPHDEPYAGLWRMQLDRATVAITAQVGAATMLTGIGADEIFDVQPYFLADLLRQGRLLRAWREAGRWARGQNSSRWVIFKTFGVAALAWSWLSGGLGHGSIRLTEQTEYSVPPWVVPEFARRYDLRRRAADQARKLHRNGPNTTLAVTAGTLLSRPGDILRWSVAAPLGIAVAHPFLDSRLLTLGLGIQARLRPEPGRMKPVLAAAMRGRLPEQITRRRGKGHFDEIYYRGLARNLARLEDLVRHAPLEDLGLFDKDLLIRQLEEASLGGANARQLQRLDLSLALVKWLAMQNQVSSPPQPPAWFCVQAKRTTAGTARPRP